MSVSDYIHPGWGESARKIRQFFRVMGDSKGPAGVESHLPWCGSGVTMQNGRCASCDALRHPPHVQRSKQLKESWPTTDFDYEHRVVEMEGIAQERRQKIERERHEREQRRIEMQQRRHEIEMQHDQRRKLKPRALAYPCARCGSMTNNESRYCHRCKVRMDIESRQKRAREEVSHTAMYLGDGKMISPGLDAMVATQCKNCSAIYYFPGPCPWCPLVSVPSGHGE